jgi:hypothetical protein
MATTAKYAIVSNGPTYYSQSDPFNKTPITCDHFCAYAKDYVVGSTSVTFKAQFGDVAGPTFTRVFTKEYEVGGTVLSNWDTDPEYILNHIAAFESLTVTSFTDLGFTKSPFE